VRQYRHAVRDWLLEIPAGRLERAEDPLHAAQRELEEETGYRARDWSALLSFYPAPGFCSERMTLFHARGLERVDVGRKPKDHDEEIEVVRLSAREALRQAASDAKSWIAAAILSGVVQKPAV
jgi:ADP-ribose pyrophosphatase